MLTSAETDVSRKHTLRVGPADVIVQVLTDFSKSHV